MAGASRHGSWALSCSTLRSPNAVEEVCRLGLFRSVMPCQLLSSFGVIFQDSLSALLAAGNCKARCPTREQVQGAGEHVFAKSTETDHVDLFIGHSWKAGRWEKFFSLCTYFNLQFAIACSFTAWFVVVALLVGSMGVTGLGGSMLLFPCLVCFPMVTFAIVLIFGHELPLGRSLPSCWLDRICIHQTDMDKKKEQINALPVFVAQSSKMLVLWDQTYFERLWCNLELATCARYGGTDKIELMPLWLAPWLLSTIFLDLLSAGILEIMFHLFPNYSAAWMHDISEMSESIFGHNPAMESFVSTFAVWMFSGIAYLPVSIPSFCFRAKLLSHQLMLEQMSTFDVRAAHCTVASDRASIEEQVTALFSGMEDKTAAPLPSAVDVGEVVLQRFEPLQEDPLVRFNAFIRGNLREFVISQIGDELSVPYHICLVAFLPMIFYSSVNVLGCDNGPCASSAKLESYRSVSEYMITQTVGWFLVLVLASPLTYPLLLRMITFVLSFGDGPLQLLLAFLCCPLAYIYMYVCGGIWWGSLVALMTREPSAIQLLVFLLVLAVLIMQLLWLFQNPSRRRTESCRCVKRQTYEALAHVQSGE